MRFLRLVPLLLPLALLACSGNSSSSSPPKLEPYSAPEDSVAFDLAPVEHTDKIWVGMYVSQGRTAKFRIELGRSEALSDKDFRMSSGHGKFVSLPGSDAAVFVADLARALQARKAPSNVKRVDALAFDYVILGENQSRSRDGGFSDSPKGDWTATKIFLGDDQGEVFLNLNPTSKKAEFSIKDSEYGDFVVAELAKVL